MISNEDNTKLEKLFHSAQKPTRYVGGEYNVNDVAKPHDFRMVLAFPDLYEVGMSNLGIKILYHLVGGMDGVICERCFAPDTDLAQSLRAEKIPLMSIETRLPLATADILGFSVQFELLYTNILYMLDLANIPFYAKDRGEEFPIILAGGTCMVNPEPIAPYFDAMIVGEGEESLPAFVAACRKGKMEGKTKSQILQSVSAIDGVYIPSLAKTERVGLFDVVTDVKVKKAVCSDFENSYYPIKTIVSNMEIVHDRGVAELYRGCANGCRFCQAGFYYRPIRARSAGKMLQLCADLIVSTGYDEISLSSLSTSDYKNLKELMPPLKKLAEENNVQLSLPSLRVDTYDESLSENSRRSSLTFAPEAGTDRLRRVINKNITEEDILRSVGIAFSQGYCTVKLYFMLGLPTETAEDIEGIVSLVEKIKRVFDEKRTNKKFLNISVSTAVFIPKPLTPFQFEPQITLEEMNEKQRYLKDRFWKIKGVSFHYHEALSSRIEAALARGDRRLATVIENAYLLGSHFDSWTEHFIYENWIKAFETSNIDIDEYTGAINGDVKCVWEFIDCGVTKAYLQKERDRAQEGLTTPSCQKSCNGCGANRLVECDIC